MAEFAVSVVVVLKEEFTILNKEALTSPKGRKRFNSLYEIATQNNSILFSNSLRILTL